MGIALAEDLADTVSAEDHQAAQNYRAGPQALLLMAVNAEQRQTIEDLGSLIDKQAHLIGTQRDQMRSADGIARMVRELKAQTPEDVRTICAALALLADRMTAHGHDMDLVADRLQEAHDACAEETKRQSYIGAVVDGDFSGD